MHDAKSSLSRLVKRAGAGEDILIARGGKPVAMLTRIPDESGKIPWDVFKGQIRMAPDFDEVLDDFKEYV
jgi:antitoxin (DNA-binding transcriptional repressor) of toxin-antitoxin stability system